MEINSKSIDNKRRVIGAILGPVVATALWFIPIDALSPIAHHLLAIMSLVAIWWITEPVPISCDVATRSYIVRDTGCGTSRQGIC